MAKSPSSRQKLRFLPLAYPFAASSFTGFYCFGLTKARRDFSNRHFSLLSSQCLCRQRLDITISNTRTSKSCQTDFPSSPQVKTLLLSSTSIFIFFSSLANKRLKRIFMQAEAMGPGKQTCPLFEAQAVLYCLVPYSDLSAPSQKDKCCRLQTLHRHELHLPASGNNSYT